MARQFLTLLMGALVLAPVAAGHRAEAAQQQRSQPVREARDARPPDHWKWWVNPEHRRELGITDAQSAQIEQIFESSFPAQRVKWREAEKLEAELATMLKESTADVSAVQQLAEKVERLHAERRTMRAVMVYRMGLVLSPEQRVKLEAFNKRREENNRRRQNEKTRQRP